jgi:hypothetical protein
VGKYLPATRRNINDWASVVPEDELAALRKAGYFLDLWHWRAHRSSPIDASDDQYVFELRGGDAGRGPFADNWDSEKKQPRFMLDPEKTGRRTLNWDDLIQRKLAFDDVYFISESTAVPFDSGHTWKDGDTIPRRLLRPGDGSHGDIKVAGKARWRDGYWDVTLTRAMDTGNPADDNIKGLLSKSPAESLQLDDFSEELYSDDCHGRPIEDLIPDYSILDQITYRYPVRDAYFAYTSRGCIRKCSFCGVLEGAQRDTESLTDVVRGIETLYGQKKDLVLMDNNVVASALFKGIISEIRDLGFVPGAKVRRPNERVASLRRVDFNQGVDARILCKDKMYLRELSTICLKPLRIAFDHLGLRGPYEKAVRYAHEFGLTELSNYMLYNFHDNPTDLFERMRLNVALNEELGIRIWSFPMRYQPTNRPDRGYIGERWTRYQIRSVQIILQATHGIVSGEPTFFKRAFGDTPEEFHKLLLLPHDFIFNRDWYEHDGGRAELDEYNACAAKLSEGDRAELLQLLSSCDPSEFGSLASATSNRAIKAILPFYVPVPKSDLFKLWDRDKTKAAVAPTVSDEERVEDAGLEADEPPLAAKRTSTNSKPTRRERAVA